MTNNRHTRINLIRSNIDNFNFAIAIGHGQHKPALPPVLVPDNIYVVFMTAPGYLGHVQNTTSSKFKNVFLNKNKVRQLVRGTLPMNQRPTLLTQKQWDWKKHIYPPHALIANHELELFDMDRMVNYPPPRHLVRGNSAYDRISGLWFLRDPSSSIGHGLTVNLQQILNEVRQRETGKVMLFISGCRGDPAIAPQSLNAAMALNANGYERLVGPQVYRVPLTNYLKSIRNTENESRRYMGAKRLASNSNSGSASSNSNLERNLNLNISSGALNKYKRMVERIQNPMFGVRGNRQLQVEAARRYFPNFFPRNMTTENIRSWINTIKRNNANLTNRMTTLWSTEPVENNWRNNRNVARRILYRIRNLERNSS